MEHKHNSEGEEIINNNIMIEKKDRFLPISILVAAIFIGGALIFVALYKGNSPSGATAGAGTGQQAPTPTNTNVMQLSQRDEVLGNASAPVTMIEYGDFQCPFCGIQFFAKTEPLIIQNYVNTGKVKFVFRNFAFLGPESTAAAEAFACATDQGKSWAYHDALYAAKVVDVGKGGTENDGFFSTAELLKLAGQAGLSVSTFTSCLQNHTDANMVNQDKTAASAQGINSTPTFFINGTQVLGAQPYAQFQMVLDAALAAK